MIQTKTFGESQIRAFTDYLERNGFPHNTVRAYKSDLYGLLEFCQSAGCSIYLDGEVASYLNAGRAGLWAPKTVGRKLGTFRAFSTWYDGDEMLPQYRAPKPARAKPHPVEGGIDTVIAMIDHANTIPHRALIAMCGLAGLRVGEAVSIRPCDYNKREQMLTVLGKGSKERMVPLNLRADINVFRAVELANRLHDDTIVPIHERKARQAITRIGARVGVKVSSHDLRATFATAAYNKSKDLRAVQELLGHADPAQTQVYVDVSEGSLRNAADVG